MTKCRKLEVINGLSNKFNRIYMFLLKIRFVILILMSGMLVYFSLLVSSRSELDVPMNAKSFEGFSDSEILESGNVCKATP